MRDSNTHSTSDATLKLLALDIETAPALVYTFNVYNANIGHNQVVEYPRIIAFSAQWQGSKKVEFYSEYHHSRTEMLEKLHSLLEDADGVVTFNGDRFDLPWIEGEFIAEGMTPPSPVLKIDLYKVVKKHTRWVHKKLDVVARRLLEDRKVEHQGFGLWFDCLRGEEEAQRKAWNKMKKYACLTPDHKVLTTDLRWEEIGSLDVGDTIVGFDEEANQNGTLGRRVKPSTVLGNRRDSKEVFAVHLSNGDVVKTTGDHRWLTRTTRSNSGQGAKRPTGGSTWTRTDDLIFNGKRVNGRPITGSVSEDYCTRVDKYITPASRGTDYDTGWLSGMLEGEGSLSMRPGERGQQIQTYVGGFTLSVSQAEGPTLDKLMEVSTRNGFQPGLHMRAPGQGAVQGTKRMGRITYGGGFWSTLDLLVKIRPERLISNLDWSRMPRLERGEAVYVTHVESLGVQEIVILETSTKTFIADGYPMHNCKDTALLWPLFEKLLPWIKMPHPVSNVEGLVCRNCAGTHLQRRGTSKTLQGEYPRYQCMSCSTWMRGPQRSPVGETRTV